jgi:hypothetical protein
MIKSDVIALTDIMEQGLGDHFCATTALRNYANENNKKIILFSAYPKLFLNIPYIEKSLALEDLSKIDHGELLNIEYDKFKYLLSNKDFRDTTNVVEQYCESLKVKKNHFPYYEITTNKWDVAKNTILVALKTGSKKKSVVNYKEVTETLKKKFPKFTFITSSQLQHIPYELLPEFCSKCVGYISINSGYFHLFNNLLARKRGIHLYVSDVYKIKFGYKGCFDYKFNKVIHLESFLQTFDKVFVEKVI